MWSRLVNQVWREGRERERSKRDRKVVYIWLISPLIWRDCLIRVDYCDMFFELLFFLGGFLMSLFQIWEFWYLFLASTTGFEESWLCCVSLSSFFNYQASSQWQLGWSVKCVFKKEKITLTPLSFAKLSINTPVDQNQCRHEPFVVISWSNIQKD